MYMAGLQNDVIKAAQTALNARGFGPLVVDGLNGPKTIAAVKAFQASKGLAVDGIVGPKTASALAEPIRTDNSALPPTYTSAQVQERTGVAPQTQSPPALPTGSVKPQGDSGANGPIFSPPPQIVEIQAAPVATKSSSLLPLLLAGAAAVAALSMR